MSYLTVHKPYADKHTDLHRCIYCGSAFTYNVLREADLADGGFGYECRSERKCEDRIRASWAQVSA